MKEEWSPIENFSDYSVSNTGFVVNEETGRVMKGSLNREGLA